MAVGIGASGFMGVAVETTAGTWVTPSKFFPFMSESLRNPQNNTDRRVIRGTADVIGTVAGNRHVEGDIQMELMPDVLVHFLQAARGTLVQDDTSTPDMVYTFTPGHGATAPNTLSITVVRNGVVFTYVGCVVSSMTFGQEGGTATVTFSILGLDDHGAESVPSPTYDDVGPYAAGEYTIEVPTTTQVFDVDNFTFAVDDSGTVQNRLKDSRGAAFISFGERNVTVTLERDFEARTEYDAFRQLTASSVKIHMERSNDSDDYVTLTAPTTIRRNYDVNLSSVGDLVRASVEYGGIHDTATGAAYTIEVGTQEDLGLAS